MDIHKITESFGTPLYVYKEDEIINNYRTINDSMNYQNKQIHFAVM